MTIYYILETIHIFAGSLFFISNIYISYAWFTARVRCQPDTVLWVLLMPTALIQVLTGFSIISLKKYPYQSPWIIGTVVGFIVLITGWYTWVWLYHQYQLTQRFRFLLSSLATILVLCLLIIIYLMTNHI